MKSFIFALCIVLPFVFHARMQIDVNSYQFYNEKSYAEIHVRAFGNTLVWLEEGDHTNAEVEIVLRIMSHKDSTIIAEKLILSGQSTSVLNDLLLVRRYVLPTGDYTIEVEGKDVHTESGSVKIQQKLSMEPRDSRVFVSDIEILSKLEKADHSSDLTRGDWYMEPLPYGILTASDSILNVYFETYSDMMLSGDYFIRYQIFDANGSESQKPLLVKYEKLQPKSIESHVFSQPVQGLRSGDYIFIVTIIDKAKNIIKDRQVRFIKENPKADLQWMENMEVDGSKFLDESNEDELIFDLKSLVPIIDNQQINTLHEVIKSGSIQAKRNYLYAYWKKQSMPENAYRDYRQVALAVNKQFQTNAGLGIQSDRGYIFLKYGKPTNVITVDTEVDAPPYEIWYYYYLSTTKQTNVRFLFYNPSLVHNDFQLLHSTCLTERKNEDWEKILYKHSPENYNPVQGKENGVNVNFNRNARRYFEEY